MGVDCQCHAPAAVPPKRAGTRCTGSWVFPSAGVENLAPTGFRSPDRPGRNKWLYRLHYPGSLRGMSINSILYRETRNQLDPKRLKTLPLVWRDSAPPYTCDILKRPVTFCTTRHSLKQGIACICQSNAKYFTAYVSTFSSILHYDLAHVFDFHLFSSKTSRYIFYSLGCGREEVTSFLYEILLSFL